MPIGTAPDAGSFVAKERADRRAEHAGVQRTVHARSDPAGLHVCPRAAPPPGARPPSDPGSARYRRPRRVWQRAGGGGGGGSAFGESSGMPSSRLTAWMMARACSAAGPRGLRTSASTAAAWRRGTPWRRAALSPGDQRARDPLGQHGILRRRHARWGVWILRIGSRWRRARRRARRCRRGRPAGAAALQGRAGTAGAGVLGDGVAGGAGAYGSTGWARAAGASETSATSVRSTRSRVIASLGYHRPPYVQPKPPSSRGCRIPCGRSRHLHLAGNPGGRYQVAAWPAAQPRTTFRAAS